MRTLAGFLAGIILGTTAYVAAEPNTTLPIHCETYTNNVHSCTVKDAGSPYKIRLRYLLNGDRFFIDSITSTCRLDQINQSGCFRKDVFTGPYDKATK